MNTAAKDGGNERNLRMDSVKNIGIGVNRLRELVKRDEPSMAKDLLPSLNELLDRINYPCDTPQVWNTLTETEKQTLLSYRADVKGFIIRVRNLVGTTWDYPGAKVKETTWEPKRNLVPLVSRPRVRRRRVTDEERHQMWLMFQKGHGLKAIAIRFGCSRGTVSENLRHYYEQCKAQGYKMDQFRNPYQRTRLTDEQKSQVVTAYNDGFKLKDIAANYDLEQETVKYIIDSWKRSQRK
jgi:transposase-like protein